MDYYKKMVEGDLRQRLEDKGWEKEYIDKAVGVFESQDEARMPVITRLDKIVYWMAMLIAISGNFVISVILVPFLVTITNKIALNIIIFAISLSFGFLFNVLLKDIEALDKEHHIVAGIFIPALATINIFVITNVANHFIRLLNIQSPHNPFVIGVVYITAFVIPYAMDKVFTAEKKKKQQRARQQQGQQNESG